jgi:hypothetical protein
MNCWMAQLSFDERILVDMRSYHFMRTISRLPDWTEKLYGNYKILFSYAFQDLLKLNISEIIVDTTVEFLHQISAMSITLGISV